MQMQTSAEVCRLSQQQANEKSTNGASRRLRLQSEAGIYQYDANGHRKINQSEQQKQALSQFAEFVQKENEDILLIPARKAIENGFGYCTDNGNPYSINSNLSISRGRNNIPQERKLNSYSINVQTRIPNLSRK